MFTSIFVRRFDLRDYMSGVREWMGSAEGNDPFCIGCRSASQCRVERNEQFGFVASAEGVAMLGLVLKSTEHETMKHLVRTSTSALKSFSIL